MGKSETWSTADYFQRSEGTGQLYTFNMQAPFPWFGGKSKVAHLVWDRFGNTPNYVEPFAGSLAVLLNRPHAPGIELTTGIASSRTSGGRYRPMQTRLPNTQTRP